MQASATETNRDGLVGGGYRHTTRLRPQAALRLHGAWLAMNVLPSRGQTTEAAPA